MLRCLISRCRTVWDSAVSNPSCTRIGKSELHSELPLQKMMRRCLLADNGTVLNYLSPTDSTKLDTNRSFRWIAGEKDDTKIRSKLPAEVNEMIEEAIEADINNDPGTFMNATEAIENAGKMLVPKVLSVKEWELLCYKYSFPW